MRCHRQSAVQEDTVRAIRLTLTNVADPEVVEAWTSEPNEGLNDRTLDVLAGNTRGGTSAINGAQFSLSLIHISEPTRPY